LQEAYSSDPAVHLQLVDWDTEGCTSADQGMVAITDVSGRSQIVRAVNFPAVRLDKLAGTDAGEALERAGLAPQAELDQEKEFQTYGLMIDGPLLRQQREALLDVIHLKLTGETYEALEGLLNLLDEISDQAHDLYGIDCLLEDTPEPGESQPDGRISNGLKPRPSRSTALRSIWKSFALRWCCNEWAGFAWSRAARPNQESR
jgi:hypothetical protein